jgi:hypothetical protein
MIKYKHILYFMVLLASCSKPLDVHLPQVSYNYYPLAVGDERLFELVRISYAVGTKTQTDTLAIKELVQSKTEKNGVLTYQILRLSKGQNDFLFKPELSYQNRLSPQNVVSTEKNQNLQLLNFPLFVGASWNLNEHNTQDKLEAKIVLTDSIPPQLLGQEYIYKVEVEDFQSVVNFKRKYSLYSKGYGLVFSENTDIDYCQDDDCRGKFIISSGQREYKRLISYKPGQ